MTKTDYTEAVIGEESILVSAIEYHEDDLSLLKTSTQIKKYRESIEKNKNRIFIVSHSTKRARYDEKHRATLLDKIERQLNKTSNSVKLISNSAIKKFTSAFGKSENHMDQNKIDSDAQ